jgi:hypothetical protein
LFTEVIAPDKSGDPESSSVQYRVADVDVAITAPPAVLGLLFGAYRRFPKREGAAEVTLSITRSDSGWDVFIGDRFHSSALASAGNANVALQIANAVIVAVAQRSRFLIMHAAGVERNGEVLCLAGASFSGKTLLTAHLASRGWRVLSDEYAFVEPRSGQVVAFPKLLYVRSSALPLLPRTFRRAVEASPWHGFGEAKGIAFSAVDPAHSYSDKIWSTGARLSRLAVIDGRTSGAVELVDCDPWSIIPELNALTWQGSDLLDNLSKLATALRGVRVARFAASGPVETVNALERWALSSSTAG